LEIGADDFLHKPFSVESMSKKLNEVLEGVKTPPETPGEK
jgi:DNA-binding response OmpR family regulator